MAGSETIYRVWIISLIFYKHVWQAEKSYIIVLQSMRDVTKRDKVARYLWGGKKRCSKRVVSLREWEENLTPQVS
jgi:hypothetical protein